MNMSNTFTEKQGLEATVKNSRSNLLFVVAFTLLNIVLLVTQSNSYFLFSAYVPYIMVSFGMLYCGMYPEEYYAQEFPELGSSEMAFLPTSFFAVMLTVALVITALYLLSWIFSRKNRIGWLIFALVFFVIDTLAMFLLMGFAVDSIIDIIFHVWVVFSLVRGIIACAKLRKMPVEVIEVQASEQEDVAVVEVAEVTEEKTETAVNSPVLRPADNDVKSRILLEGEALGHAVAYRRVKKVNELVIDGNVYDEFEALVEMAHSLKAEIDGHLIEVGYNGIFHSYLKVDGEIVAKKLRLW